MSLATQFIKAIGSQDSGLWTEEHEEADNQLMQELKLLQQKLKEVAKEEKQRTWQAEGQAIFGQIIRNNQDDLEKLTSLILSKLVAYINANQGSVFIAKELEGRTVLEQIASYAYGRKKFQTCILEIGEGLLGQTFLEKETTFLSDVPDGYVYISSGLGEATPNCVIIIPIKINEVVLGVLELASFSVFPKHVVDFLEKVTESLASAISSVKVAEKTKRLLQETQEQSELMRAQEEELRQNMEEMQATHEEMMRKQKELDQKSNLIKLILDNLPIPTFVKDENGVYTLVNKAQAQLLNLNESEIIGKDDTFFTTKEDERVEIRRTDIAALLANKAIELPMQSFTTKNGRTYVFKTTKVSFENSVTEKRNIIGISIDMTDRINLEKKMLSEKVVQQNNVIIDLAGRQRMLSQKIGFYCEMICRGQKQHVNGLRKLIDLHDHSLETIKFGGWPIDMEAQVPIEKANEELLPYIEKIETVWLRFKEAADQIVALGGVESPAQIATLENIIVVIEENGEALLKANNQLLMQYKILAEKELDINE